MGSELHFIIQRLPQYMKVQGIFTGGTSEGAMTIARFDDQRYGHMILGRFINSFSIEYCYFTPTPECGKLGGALEVPTLNIIGMKDQFFVPSTVSPRSWLPTKTQAMAIRSSTAMDIHVWLNK